MGHKDIQTTMDIYAEATEEKKQESFERLAATLDIFWSNKEGLLLSVLSDSKILPRTANWQQKHENDGELRRIVNTGYTDKKCFVKRYEALQVDFGKHPHDEAHRLKSIDSTPFINPVWLIWHHIDTKLAEKALQK